MTRGWLSSPAAISKRGRNRTRHGDPSKHALTALRVAIWNGWGDKMYTGQHCVYSASSTSLEVVTTSAS